MTWESSRSKQKSSNEISSLPESRSISFLLHSFSSSLVMPCDDFFSTFFTVSAFFFAMSQNDKSSFTSSFFFSTTFTFGAPSCGSDAFEKRLLHLRLTQPARAYPPDCVNSASVSFSFFFASSSF